MNDLHGTYKNPYIAGTPVDVKEMFFGRQDVFEFLKRNLIGQYQNNPIVLYGNQRTGKTSVLKQMRHYLVNTHVCVFIDLQGLKFDGISHFLWQVALASWKALQAEGISLEQPSATEFSQAKDPCQYFSSEFLKRVGEVIGDRRLLIMYDEVERLREAVRDGKIDTDIFRYLRYLMQDQTVANSIYCMGSQPRSMEHEFAQIFRAAIYKEISFLERSDALELITRPVKGLFEYSQSACDEIYRLTSGHPYFLQLVCHSLFNHWQMQPREKLTMKDVQAVLAEVVEKSRSHMLIAWEKLTADEKAILAALAETITQQNGATREDIEQKLQEYELSLAAGQVTAALQSLSESHTIYPDEPHYFRVDLFRRWIHDHKRMGWVKAELSEKVTIAVRKAVEHPEEVRRRYLLHVQDSYRWVDFRGLMLLPELFTLPLHDIYVPLQVTVARSEEVFKQLALRARARFLAEQVSSPSSDINLAVQRELADEMRRLAASVDQRRVDAGHLLEGYPRLVILGDPGAGKTTFLRYLALTFAEGPKIVKDRLGWEAEWLPILLPIGAYAAARRIEPELSLADYLPRYFASRDLDLPELSSYFQQELSAGRCLLLLDGLDTVIDSAERFTIARQVESFINQYTQNHYVVTSRIEGYREAQLVGDYLHCTACDLDMPEIDQFANRWSLACETRVVDNAEHRSKAKVQASRLIEAIRTSPGVRRLSANPLLLTIIALANQLGRLPHHRVALYAECTRTLIERWNQVRSLSMEPISLPMDAEEAFRNFGPLALWMHEEKRGGTVSSKELERKLKELIVERGIPAEDASAAARTFLEMERNQIGLLVERGVDAYGFSHLTFQEYFTAQALTAKRDKMMNKLLEHLHDPRWREVVLLTAGQIGVQQHEEEPVTALTQVIADNHSPYEEILHRDLLLAGRCLADDVGVGYRQRGVLLDRLINLWHAASFERLRQEITEVMAAMRGTACERQIIKALLSDLNSDDDEIRELAANALGRMGMTSDAVLNDLMDTLRGDIHARVRSHAALAFSRLNVAPERVTRALDEALRHDENREVRQRAAEALAYIGEANEQAIELLLAALENEDGNVRGSAAAALTSLRKPQEELVNALIKALGDSRVDVRTHASEILGRLGQHSHRAVVGLLGALRDINEDARMSAIMALGQAGDSSEAVVQALIERLGDDNRLVRKNAAAALGKLALKSNAVITALERVSQDDRFVVGAVDALGRAGKTNLSITQKAERQLQAQNWQDRIRAVEALVSVDKEGQASQKVINTLADVLHEERRMGWDLQVGTAMTLSEVARRSDAALKMVVQLLNNESWVVRTAAVEALGLAEKATPEVIQALINTLNTDIDDHARGNAAAALGALGVSTDEVVTMLVAALHDTQGYVRLSAANALSMLGVRGRREVLNGLINLLEDGYYSHYHARHVRDAAFDALWTLAPYSAAE